LAVKPKEVVMESIGGEKRSVRRGIAAGAVVLALLGIGGLAAQASGPDWSEFGPSAYREAAGLADRLGLTAEQQEKVRGILSETFAKHRKIREDGQRKMEALREEGRKKMESLEEETDKALSAVLTPEQASRFRKLREERRDHRRDHQMDPRGEHGPFPGGPEGRFPG
jgi:Spy/CpxP family protein refolding chaperone